MVHHGEALRTTRAYIHLEALKANLQAIRLAIPEGTMICGAVKANAYGHGAVPVSRLLRAEGVEVLGVATPFEGKELRDAGDGGRIILLGPTAAGEIPMMMDEKLEPIVVSSAHLDAIESHLDPSEGSLPVHLKVDTGMGRVGCTPQEAPYLAKRIQEAPQLHLAGTATHFPVADSDAPDDLKFTQKQRVLFKKVLSQMKGLGLEPGIVHGANTGSVALSPENSLDMVRPGIGLYGYGAPYSKASPWHPVMELKTRITSLKKVPRGTTISYGRTWKAAVETWIATLPIGYADGYSRRLSNKSRVLIDGSTYPIVGLICMDQCMVDLGPETDIALGDEVVLFGPDPTGPDAQELALLSDTISYEIICSISPRVPRIYID